MYFYEVKKGEELERFNVGNELNVRISAEYSKMNEESRKLENPF